MTKEIPLTRGYVAYVDDEDYDFLNQWKWFYTNGTNGHNGYAARQIRPVPRQRQKTIYMHVVLLMPPMGMVVDHINGITSDNRRKNLRVCTKKQNSQNKAGQSLRASKTSQYRGVTWDKATNKWMAQISINMKRTHIGRYDCEKEAALAYNDKAIQAYGEFANPNFFEEKVDEDTKILYHRLVKEYLTT